jgi:hypothetical protein
MTEKHKLRAATVRERGCPRSLTLAALTTVFSACPT